jgi:DNA invertase Pin-like site-specific DNA recombinase
MNSDSGDKTGQVAIAYLRVSTETQLDGFGLDGQETAVREFCQEKGHTLQHIFAERGVSGQNDLENRVALVQLNEYAQQNGVTTIVIPTLSRLARDLMVQERILSDWQSRGWTVLSTKEPDLNGNDPTRKFIRQVLGAVNEYDRAMIIARLKAGRISKASLGGHAVGAVPLGYKIDNSGSKPVRIVDDDEAEIVRTIHRLREQRWSYQAIADQLNESGVPPRKSDLWGKTSVRAIYVNPKYRGIVQYVQDGEILATSVNEHLRLIDNHD